MHWRGRTSARGAHDASPQDFSASRVRTTRDASPQNFSASRVRGGNRNASPQSLSASRVRGGAHDKSPVNFSASRVRGGTRGASPQDFSASRVRGGTRDKSPVNFSASRVRGGTHNASPQDFSASRVRGGAHDASPQDFSASRVRGGTRDRSPVNFSASRVRGGTRGASPQHFSASRIQVKSPQNLNASRVGLPGRSASDPPLMTTHRGTPAFAALKDLRRPRDPTSPPPTGALRFPPVDMTEERLDAFHDTAHKALSQTVREFVKLDGKQIDPNRWRYMRSRSGVSAFYDRRPLSPQLSSVLVAGTIKGRLADVLEGLYMENSEDTLLIQRHVSSRFVDAEVLKVIERRSPDHPFAFTGLKWALLKNSSSIISNRDLCFLEKLGMVDIGGGRKLGYFIMQSVDLPECPPAQSGKTVRANVSLCYLFEEVGDGLVGMYMTGNMESHGPQILWKMARNNFADIALSLSNTVHIAYAKRYARLMRSKPQPSKAKSRSLVCAICKSLPSFFDHHYECAGCEKTSVCKKCRVKCKVFEREHSSTSRFAQAWFCYDCVEKAHSTSEHYPYPSEQDEEEEQNGDEADDDDDDLDLLAPFRLPKQHESFSSSFYTETEDESSDELPDSERSLRRFSLKLLQQLEDAGFHESDAGLRLTGLESLGTGDFRRYCIDGDSEDESETEQVPVISRPASSLFSAEDLDIDVDIDDVEFIDSDYESPDEEEVLSIRPLRRSTQPPEMLEAQQLNRDGSLRVKAMSYSHVETAAPESQNALLARLMQATHAAEQTFRMTTEQSKKAQSFFARRRYTHN